MTCPTAFRGLERERDKAGTVWVSGARPMRLTAFPPILGLAVASLVAFAAILYFRPA